jgi:outer membrane biosynthesis protein TonB
MEMKDVVLSALAEIQSLEQEIAVMSKLNLEDEPKSDKAEPKTPPSSDTQTKSEPKEELVQTSSPASTEPQRKPKPAPSSPKETPKSSDEVEFLKQLRERLLVLFEGFQSPNNENIEAKIDITLNFLEYMLATLDNRIEKLKPKKER